MFSIPPVEALLEEVGITAEPEVLRLAVRHYSSILSLAVKTDSADVAREAYALAEALPCAATEANLRAKGIWLKDVLHSGSTLLKCFKGTAVLVLKPINQTEYRRAQRLQAALLTLDEAARRDFAASGITPFELHDDVSSRGKLFMTMPLYAANLAEMPPCSLPVAVQLWEQMKRALGALHSLPNGHGADSAFLHSSDEPAAAAAAPSVASSLAKRSTASRRGFVHGDVTPANICVTFGGDFVLVDLGSVVPVGAATQSTGAYLPWDVELEQPASPQLDWLMLAMTLAKTCCGDGSASPRGGRPSKKQLSAHLRAHLPPAVWAELSALAYLDGFGGSAVDSDAACAAGGAGLGVITPASDTGLSHVR